MSDTPKDLVSVKILVDGSPIDDAIEVLEVSSSFSLNRIASAKLVVNDGDPAKETFELSSGSVFVPGNEIEIQAGFGSQTKTIFKGMIISQSIQGNYDTGSSLEIECRDKALRMTLGRKSGAFSKQSDSEVISSIASRNGVAAIVKPTKPQSQRFPDREISLEKNSPALPPHPASIWLPPQISKVPR